MPQPGYPWTITGKGLDIRVRLTPRAGHDRIDGLVVRSDRQSVIAARVRAVPEKGRVNAALEALLAKTLGVAKSAVLVTGGTTSRIKTVRVDGDPVALDDTMQLLVASRQD